MPEFRPRNSRMTRTPRKARAKRIGRMKRKWLGLTFQFTLQGASPLCGTFPAPLGRSDLTRIVSALSNQASSQVLKFYAVLMAHICVLYTKGRHEVHGSARLERKRESERERVYLICMYCVDLYIYILYVYIYIFTYIYLSIYCTLRYVHIYIYMSDLCIYYPYYILWLTPSVLKKSKRTAIATG